MVLRGVRGDGATMYRKAYLDGGPIKPGPAITSYLGRFLFSAGCGLMCRPRLSQADIRLRHFTGDRFFLT